MSHSQSFWAAKAKKKTKAQVEQEVKSTNDYIIIILVGILMIVTLTIMQSNFFEMEKRINAKIEAIGPQVRHNIKISEDSPLDINNTINTPIKTN